MPQSLDCLLVVMEEFAVLDEKYPDDNVAAIVAAKSREALRMAGCAALYRDPGGSS